MGILYALETDITDISLFDILIQAYTRLTVPYQVAIRY